MGNVRSPNLVDYWGDWFPSSFVSGAVAASLKNNNCTGYINAFEDKSDTWGHVTGYALGYQWYKQKMKHTGTMHVVTMNSYYQPHVEVVAAQELVQQKGCNVIGKHTDPNTVDQYIYSLRNNLKGREIVSISRYIDMSLFVGDTVIFSQVTNFFQAFLPTME